MRGTRLTVLHSLFMLLLLLSTVATHAIDDQEGVIWQPVAPDVDGTFTDSINGTAHDDKNNSDSSIPVGDDETLVIVGGASVVVQEDESKPLIVDGAEEVVEDVIDEDILVEEPIFEEPNIIETAAPDLTPDPQRNPVTGNVCQPQNTLHFEFPGCWYLGAGQGLSHVEPDVGASSWSVVDNMDLGFEIQAGYHFLPQWFAEFNYTDLGEAELKHSNPAIVDTAFLSYKIPEVTLGYYVFNPLKQDWNLYVKAGIAHTMVKSTAPFMTTDLTMVSVSVGAQYHIGERWLARAEYNYYSTDARYLGLTLSRYFGESLASVVMPQHDIISEPKPELISESVSEPESKLMLEPVLISEFEPVLTPQLLVEIQPIMELNLVVEIEPIMAAEMMLLDIYNDNCTGLTLESVNTLGCAGFEGELKAVQFSFDSKELSQITQVLLNEIIATLEDYPQLNIEIQGHTDDQGEEAYNMYLSWLRAQNVLEYFIDQGISPDRLSAQSYGARKPKASNGTPEGQAINRRVDFEAFYMPISNQASGYR